MAGRGGTTGSAGTGGTTGTGGTGGNPGMGCVKPAMPPNTAGPGDFTDNRGHGNYGTPTNGSTDDAATHQLVGQLHMDVLRTKTLMVMPESRQVRLNGNAFIGNGRSGLLLLDGSRGSATGNTFDRNHKAGVELGEQARATLTRNRFGGNLRLDIDAGCGSGLSGKAEIGEGNRALGGPLRQRTCPNTP